MVWIVKIYSHVTSPYSVNILTNRQEIIVAVMRCRLETTAFQIHHTNQITVINVKLVRLHVLLVCWCINEKDYEELEEGGGTKPIYTSLRKHCQLRKMYKPWMIWHSGFLGNLPTNTNLHSNTSCTGFKAVYKINLQAIWLYYYLSYDDEQTVGLLALFVNENFPLFSNLATFKKSWVVSIFF